MATPSKARIVKKSEKEAQLEREVAELRRQLASAGANPNGIKPGGPESSYSHSVYGTLIELFPQAVWMTDAQGQNIYSNRFWHEFSGMTFEQTAGSGWVSAVHPEDVARGQWAAAVARGETFENEVRFRRRDGVYRWHITRALPLKDAQGRVMQWIGIAIDIHDRKTAVAAVNEANERMLMAVESAGAGTWDYYPKAGKVEGSGRTLEMFQVPPGTEPTQELFIERIHPKDRDRMVEMIRRTTDPQIAGSYDCDYRILWPSGQVRWLFAKGTCFFSGEGAAREAVRISGIVVDVTERKEAEQERTRLIAALQNSPDFIGITDVWGRIMFLNRGGQEMVGLRDDAEALSKRAHDFVFPEDQPVLEKEILPLVLDGKVWEREVTMRHFVTGKPVLVETRVFGVYNDSGKLTNMVNLSRDISQRKEMEERLRLAQKMEAVGRLAGGIAHDFNNLLTVIRGAAEVLEERWEKSGSNLEVIKEISDAAERASALTEQLLAFGKRQMVRPRATDLNHVIERMQGMMKRLAGEDISLETRLQESLWKVKMDPIQADQILINLTANARDAMPHGGAIRISTFNRLLSQDIESTNLKPGHYVCVSFSDNGRGMDSATLSHIFEPFFTTKQPGNGTGLGLSTVYGIVQQTGGDISVRSEPGQGASFTLYFPRSAEDISLAESESDAAELQGSGSILLVEDEPSLRAVVAGYIREHGYLVHEAEDAEEAVAISRERHIDLLLTDIVMPGTSGPELAASLAPSNALRRVIFMSGYAEHAALQEAIQQPNALFLQKPFRLKTLLVKIQEAFDQAGNSEQEPAGASNS
jgi:two-component system, cell cycle sensor histidine kinase and response regulator CckA